jgi:hypothetical protein
MTVIPLSQAIANWGPPYYIEPTFFDLLHISFLKSSLAEFEAGKDQENG